jgi:bifunctional non-homologous end joining protein LigD
MLAIAGKMPEQEEGWAFEIKWDGVRAISYLEGSSLHLESRNANDISGRYPELAPLAKAVGDVDLILDGEVVAFDEWGRPSFQQLQHRMHVADPGEVRVRMATVPVMYVIFDVLWVGGRQCTDLPWSERRSLLEQLELAGPSWQVSTAHRDHGAALQQATKDQGLEGVLAKRCSSTYEVGRRSKSWVKVKNVARQEVVIGGWLPGEGGRIGRIGALVIGYHDDTGLRFAGKVGTGFTDQTLRELAATFEPLARVTSPFVDPVPWKGAQWLEPRLVCDVEFTEWTREGTLRHPSYKGLREDKAAGEVIREPTP